MRSKDTVHENLREFLQLNADNPELLLLKNVRKTLEQMSENEAFMQAIQEEALMNEQKEEEEAALQRIANGDDLDDDYANDDMEKGDME